VLEHRKFDHHFGGLRCSARFQALVRMAAKAIFFIFSLAAPEQIVFFVQAALLQILVERELWLDLQQAGIGGSGPM
jgi:hypothetical protein